MAGVTLVALVDWARAQVTPIFWNNASGGAWETATNWNPASVPNSASFAAEFTLAGSYTVTLGTSETIESLVLNNAAATVQVGTASITLSSSAAGSSAVTAGTLALSNANILGTAGVGQYTFTNAGTITAVGPVIIYGSTNGLAFTNTGAVTVSSGTLTLGDGASDSVSNSGTMTANGSTAVLTLNGGTSAIVNLGTLSATGGGTINFAGKFTTAGLGGTINGSGGTLNFTGLLNNAAATLTPPTTGIYTLAGGTITGGTVNGVGPSPTSALTFATGGTLSGVAMNGSFAVPTGANFTNNTNTTFSGGTTTFAGSDSVYVSGTGTGLTIAPSATWTGSYNIVGQAASNAVANQGTLNFTSGTNYVYNSAMTFTNTGTVNVTGGTAILGYGASDTVINSTGGTMTAGAGGTLDFLGGLGSIVNTGTLTATGGGIIDFGSNLTTADLGGTINGAGGTLNITGSLNNAAATLTPPTTGIYTLASGTITGGTVNGVGPSPTAALTFATGGTLSGVAMNGSFNVPTGANFTNNTNTTFSGGTTTFAGSDSVYVNGPGTGLTIAPSAIWTGSYNIVGQAASNAVANQGTLDFTSGSNYVYNSAMTFTNTGTVNVTGGTANLGYGASDTVINSTGGTMTAGAGGTLDFLGGLGSIVNTGTLTATAGGIVDFGGNLTTADLGGTINGAGGTLNITGSLNNAAATLTPPTTGIYTLASGTITGGTVNGVGPSPTAALTFATGGILSAVAMNGSFSVPTGANVSANTNTTFSGGTTTFAGSDTVYVSGTGTELTIAPSATWTGSYNIVGQAASNAVANQGTLNFTSGSNYIYNSAMTFTNTGTVNVTGGTTALGYGASDTVINSTGGTLSVTAGGTLNFLGGLGSIVNTGTLTATGGIINFGGNLTTADLGGTINGTGGTLNITGSLNNAAATLTPPTTGIYTLANGTITGGTVNGVGPSPTAALTFATGGILSGVAMSGGFSVPTGANFTNNTNATFSGGTTTFAGSDTVYVNGTGTELTIAPSATWTGSYNIVGQAASNAVANQGTLDFTSGSNYVYNSAMTFTNTGTVNVTGGTTTLGYGASDTVINSSTGTLAAGAGGTLNFLGGLGSIVNTGTLTATGGGIVNFAGNLTTADLGGTINGAGGTLNITGSLNNAAATLTPPTTGIYTLASGVITGGTVNGVGPSPTAALTFATGGILSGVTMNGSFTLPTGANVTANTNTTFSGGTTTFAGSDTVNVNGTGTELTIAPSATWTGSYNITGLAASNAVTNQGTLDFTSGTNYIYNGAMAFTNSGTVNVTSGTTSLGYGASDTVTNQSTGTIEASGGIINLGTGGSTVTNFSGTTLTGGTWIAAGGGTLIFANATNPIITNGPATTLVLDGSTSSILSGPSNQTLEQTLTTNNGMLEVLTNRNFASATSGLTNNGTIQLGGGTLTATSLTNGPSSTLSGFGTFNPTGGVSLGAGALVSPGSLSANKYVSSLTFNAVTLAPGGAGTFDLMNATGVAGTDYDTINVSGALTITATSGSPFVIGIESINPGTGLPGLANFNSSLSYQWTLLSAASVSGFNAADFSFNTSAFSNSLGGGDFYLSSNASGVFLNFSPIPEPSTWALMAAGVAMTCFAFWRCRVVSLAATRQAAPDMRGWCNRWRRHFGRRCVVARRDHRHGTGPAPA